MAKWINKRRQEIAEKVNKDTVKTDFSPDFVMFEQQTDQTKLAVEKIISAIPNYLHPNPAARTMKSMGTTLAKITKTAAEKRYPHSAGELGEQLVTAGQALDEDSLFGQSMKEVGEALNQISENQHSFDAEVNQNFLDPLKNLLAKDIAEIMKHRKKLDGRRLDYDFKRSKQPTSNGKITDSDVKIAEQKLDESKGLYEAGMLHLLENDVEQVSQMAAFTEALLNLYRSSADTLQATLSTLQEKIASAGDRPKREPTSGAAAKYDSGDDDDDHKPAPKAAAKSGGGQPSAKAIFDFEAENDGEISFKEGQIIKLISRLDDNWLEGEVNGKTGIFPSNYVDVLVEVS